MKSKMPSILFRMMKTNVTSLKFSPARTRPTIMLLTKQIKLMCRESASLDFCYTFPHFDAIFLLLFIFL